MTVVVLAIACIGQGRVQGADEIPLRVTPLSGWRAVDHWGAQVGAQGCIMFNLPADIGEYKQALLLLHVDDVDAPEEADLVINERPPVTWPESLVGEGDHGGVIPVDMEILMPGRNNYFMFIFKSNLNKTTTGCAVRAAELRFFKDLSAEQKARMVRESRSWGNPVDWTKPKVYTGPAPRSARQREEPVVADYFLDEPLARWNAAGGDWRVSYDMDVLDLEQRDLYRSPEEPSWVEWVSLWKEKNGDIRTCFAQYTGNLGLEPSYRFIYGRGKSEEAWRQFAKDHRLRIGPEDAVATTRCDYPTLVSHDNGDTWENLGYDQKPCGGNMRLVLGADGGYISNGAAIVRCRDGRIVATAKYQELRTKEYKWITDQFLVAVRESLDDGKTWSPLQFITPEGSDAQLIKESGEENAIVELDDGRILVMVRCDPGSPVLTYLTRTGPGEYAATPPKLLPLPHSGLPELVCGSDGVVWYWGHDGHWYTTDSGESWHRAPFDFYCYYGKMLEAAPNEMLCVTQHLIHDSPYPYWYDSSVRMYRFSWRRSGTLQQNAADQARVLCARDDVQLGDLHLRADVRVDGANGVAFRVQPDAKSFYCLLIVLPGHEMYERYFPPEIEAEVLAANYTSSDTMTVGSREPMLVIARVEGEKRTVLRGMRLKYLPRGSWVRLQVKVKDDLIQGAVNTDPPIYVGARDGHFTTGGIGLFTDTSTGAFKNVAAWASPQMIRDLWQ